MDFYIIATIIAGSRLYGLNTLKSDTDYRHVVIEPFDYMLDPRNSKDYVVANQADGTDEVTYGLSKFTNLAMRGNPSVIELLFAESENEHPYWRMLRAIRKSFLSKKVLSAYRGIISNHLDRLVAGKGRKELIDLHGYDTKDASHVYRLLVNYSELIYQGKINVRLEASHRENALAIKKGVYDVAFADLLDQYIHGFDLFNREAVSSKLPAEPDYELINETVLTIYKAAYRARP